MSHPTVRLGNGSSVFTETPLRGSPENRFEASPLRGNSTATGAFRRHLGLHAPFQVTTHRGHTLRTSSIPRIGAPEDLRPLGRGLSFSADDYLRGPLCRVRDRSRWQKSFQYSRGFAQLCPVVSNSAEKASRLIARDPIGMY